VATALRRPTAAATKITKITKITKTYLVFFVVFVIFVSFVPQPSAVSPQPPAVSPQPSRFDLVIRGGRVIDPETNLDAVRDVGITGGRIAAVSAEPLNGTAVVDARGLVVAPGFIDLHTHVNNTAIYRLAAQEGVTTALELEIGSHDVTTFLAARQGRAPINFGTSASHPWARVRAFGGPTMDALVPASQRGTESVAGDAERQAIRARLEHELDAGALGIGMGLVYTPGATRAEAIEAFRVAASRRVPVFVHVRSSGRLEPGSSIESVGEVIAAAAVTGAALHIVHINSSCTADAPECLRMIAGARARGLDVTVEGYPYGAGMTDLKSSVFNPGWQQRIGVTERDVAIPETGERLTPESFARYRAQAEPRHVLIYTNPDALVDAVITDPLTIVASDAVAGHPRAAGAFARILARYVRDQRTLTLMDAIRKMSLMPAQRLQRATAAAARKGRLQVGADADIAVFDLATVADRATYAAPAVPATGFKHVLVNGTAVVRDGQLLDVTPGRAILRDK
jgi:N-acyl-D-aspartate/D-glutamate deacylase